MKMWKKLLLVSICHGLSGNINIKITDLHSAGVERLCAQAANILHCTFFRVAYRWACPDQSILLQWVLAVMTVIYIKQCSIQLHTSFHNTSVSVQLSNKEHYVFMKWSGVSVLYDTMHYNLVN